MPHERIEFWPWEHNEYCATLALPTIPALLGNPVNQPTESVSHKGYPNFSDDLLC